MNRRKGIALGALAALSVLLAPGKAHAQAIANPRNPFQEVEARPTTAPTAKTEAGKVSRLQIGAFWTDWDSSPDPLTQALLAIPGLRTKASTASSALITADYFLRKDLSIGGWWNPVSGEINATAPGGILADLTTSGNFWDLHATYYPQQFKWAKGVSVQVGFSELSTDIDGLLVIPPTVFDVNGGTTQKSVNIWLNYSRQIAAPEVQGSKHPISLYGSFGYYFSPGFNHATNIIVGASIDINDRLALNGSVWLNDLDNTNTRISIGLVGRL